MKLAWKSKPVPAQSKTYSGKDSFISYAILTTNVRMTDMKQNKANKLLFLILICLLNIKTLLNMQY